MTVKELREEAKRIGLKGYSKLKKAELEKIISEHQVVCDDLPYVEEEAKKFEFLESLSSDIEVIVYKDEDIWLENRKLGIGGSDIGAIFGVNKYKSAIDVYTNKVIGSDFKGNKFTYWGHKLEKVVAEEFETQHDDFIVMNLDRTLKRGRALANIDRLLYSKEKGYGVLECKTTSVYNTSEWEGKTVPQNYFAQVMHYLAVTGLNYAYIACLVGGQDYKEFYIERKEEQCEYILEHCEWWWKEYIETQTPPMPDGSDSYSNYLKARADKIENNEVIELDSIKDKADKFKALKGQIESLETEKKQVEQEMMQELIKANTTKAKAGEIKVTIVTQNRISVDKKAFESSYPELIEEYKKVENEFKINKENKFLKVS